MRYFEPFSDTDDEPGADGNLSGADGNRDPEK
jgi:hypothetical protein